MSKTNWENIVSSTELKKVKALRAKTYIESKQRASALPELSAEGWEKVMDYKDPKWIKVRKSKPNCDQFEDAVWSMFCNMGFTSLNRDKNFKISYDENNENFTQQIDVFAADDETVLIVECKSADSIKNQSFKKDIEKMHGQFRGLQNEIRKKFSGCKIKQIFATKNYILGDADREKLKEWNIAYFSEPEIEYYSELVKHLGSSAKYQLLGNLFSNQDIKNMENRIPAIRGKMGNHTYYSFSIEPEKLLKIGYVLHRSEANNDMLPTYQRIIKKSRLKSVQKFIDEENGYFPNSIIISIDSKRPLRFDKAKNPVDDSIADIGILYLPKQYKSAYIIDGQHRLYGYSDSKYSKTNSIPVVAFENLDKSEQIKLFMEINENQKPVSKNLRNTLNADTQWDSDSPADQRDAIRLRIAQKLGEYKQSPLYDRVIIGEDKQTTTKCIKIETIRLSIRSGEMLSKYNKKGELEQIGLVDFDNSQKTFNFIFEYISLCLDYIKNSIPTEWDKTIDNEGIITINNGIGGIIRALGSIIKFLAEKESWNLPINVNAQELFEKSKYYIDSIIRFYENVDQDKRETIRKTYGGNGPIYSWRCLEQAIHIEHDEFYPEGLDKYWDKYSKENNSDAINKISDIEKIVKNIVKDKLVDKYGSKYYLEIPKEIYKSATEKITNELYENDNELDFWDAITLKDFKDIIIFGKNWSELFENEFTIPSQLKLPGGKQAKTEWLITINKLQKDAGKATFAVPKNEYQLICEIHEYLCE